MKNRMIAQRLHYSQADHAHIKIQVIQSVFSLHMEHARNWLQVAYTAGPNVAATAAVATDNTLTLFITTLHYFMDPDDDHSSPEVMKHRSLREVNEQNLT